MLAISDLDILARIERDNPWWKSASARLPEADYPRRVYFESFKKLSLDLSVRRATVMLGPRRVGKTVMMKQLVVEALHSGIDAASIMYVSIDTPIYSGISLERFLSFMPSGAADGQRLVLFDEIQYFRNWEVHLKDLVDSRPNVKFVVTGSAAAALRLKSQESGAGRFSDFMLPPLTFYEFLNFLGEDADLIEHDLRKDPATHQIQNFYKAKDIVALNTRFIDYLNFGGYPESVLNESIRINPERFIRNDIIDKVLLKDLPSLYGIHEIQELNKLFSFLAYNAGNEASLENISNESGITKPTIKRYIEYLESAFLIIKISSLDDNCKSLKRERKFKVYLNNPSMRAALFAPVEAGDSERIGHLAESAIFSQWQHSKSIRQMHYARWRNEGEVDIVCLHGAGHLPIWIGEIKWSDRIARNQYDETKSMQLLLRKHQSIGTCFFTSKTVSRETKLLGKTFYVWPSSLYCYMVGRNITSALHLPIPSGSFNEEKNDDEISDEFEST